MQTPFNRIRRRLREAVSVCACFALLVCMSLLVVGAGQFSLRGSQASESEAPQQDDREEHQQEELIAHGEWSTSASRKWAECPVATIQSSRVVAATARRASCDGFSFGHRLANGLLAPLRC